MSTARQALACGLVLLAAATAGSPASVAANLTVRRNPLIEKIVGEISPAPIQQTVEALVGFHTRHSASAQDDPARGIGAAARWLHARFDQYSAASNGRLKVELDEFDQATARENNSVIHYINVVATLPGRQPDRMLVVGAHYDSWNSGRPDPSSFLPGANDDASGTAAVLELARVFSQYEFDATLVFIAFAGEEQGLVGSQHWVELARAKGWNVEAMITNDIIGNIEGGNGVVDNGSVRVFSEGIAATETAAQVLARRASGSEVDSSSRQWARYVQERGEAYVPNMKVRMIYRRDRFGRGGDHTPFHEAGFAAVRFTEATENYTRQHQRVRVENGVQYGDLPEKVSYPYVAQVTRVNAAALASLALAPAPLRNVTISGAHGYDTTLRWNEPAGDASVAGYNVLVRDTDSPVWQQKRYYPKESLTVIEGRVSVVLKNVVIDNYFFAVQAVDAEGNESLPVFPHPATRRTPAPR